MNDEEIRGTQHPVAFPETASRAPLLRRIAHRTVNPLALFAKEILANPRGMGAACPSSPFLARAMAAPVAPHEEGLVLELGGGTGAVTEALLRRGVAPERLVVLEISHTLAQHLRRRFSRLRIVEGDAAELQRLLGEDYRRITTVVSSLPLRSLPHHKVRAIGAQLAPLLAQGASLIRFTYDLRQRSERDLGLHPHLIRAGSEIVWRNLPPARVDVFRMPALPKPTTLQSPRKAA